MGLLVAAIVHAAGIQDRDGAVPLLSQVRSAFPWLRYVFADGGYAGKLKAALAGLGRWTLAIVKRAAHAQGFRVLPRRWVVERTLAGLNRNRRLAKDFETSIASAEAWIMMASVKLLSTPGANAINLCDSESDTKSLECPAMAYSRAYLRPRRGMVEA